MDDHFPCNIAPSCKVRKTSSRSTCFPEDDQKRNLDDTLCFECTDTYEIIYFLDELPRLLLTSISPQLAAMRLLSRRINDLDDALDALVNRDACLLKLERACATVSHLGLDESMILFQYKHLRSTGKQHEQNSPRVDRERSQPWLLVGHGPGVPVLDNLGWAVGRVGERDDVSVEYQYNTSFIQETKNVSHYTKVS